MGPGAKKGVRAREELGLMVQKKKGRKGICKQLSEVSHPGAGRGRRGETGQLPLLWVPAPGGLKEPLHALGQRLQAPTLTR